MYFFTWITEFLSLLMFIVIILYLGVKRKDYRSIAQILAGSVFGVTLEYMNVIVFETYTYSTHFIVQVGSPPDNIPIVIGLSWGLIIWACIQVSNQIGLPKWSRPFLDGLLALTIDLSMDTIAIRLDEGFWVWNYIPMESIPTLNSFFGVNWGNFVGWFQVVLIFSVLLRLEDHYRKKEEKIDIRSIIYFCVIPFLAYIPLYFGLSYSAAPLQVISGQPIVRVLDIVSPPPELGVLIFLYTIIAAILIQIVAFFQTKPTITKKFDWVTFYIFFSFHITNLVFYLLGGFFNEAPLILPLGISMLIIDLIVHWIIIDKKELQRLLKEKFRIG